MHSHASVAIASMVFLKSLIMVKHRPWSVEFTSFNFFPMASLPPIFFQPFLLWRNFILEIAQPLPTLKFEKTTVHTFTSNKMLHTKIVMKIACVTEKHFIILKLVNI